MPPERASIGRSAVAVAVLAIAIASCSEAPLADPTERAVGISTTACGDASATSGVGVLVDDGRVLTAAHVVAGAGTVEVLSGNVRSAAQIVGFDVERDLAVLAIDTGFESSPIRLGEVARGADVRIVTHDPVAIVRATVRRSVVMTVDEVRGARRVERLGYEVDAAIEGGDSGSGVFDDAGSLVAVVFAQPTERPGVAFAVAAAEIEPVLRAAETPYACDPTRSRVTPVLVDLSDSETAS